MTLMRLNNPYTISRMFNDFFNERNQDLEQEPSWKPLANVVEKDDRFELELAVPGMEKKDFNISIEKDMLSISAEQKMEKKEEEQNYSRREFFYGKFCRSFSLPESVDREKITAEYQNGILKLQLPKMEKETLKRLVKVS